MDDRPGTETEKVKINIGQRLFKWDSVLLELAAYVFLLMVIVVIPLYSRWDYSTIGTDKRTLFVNFLEIYWKALLPFLIVYAILFFAVKRHFPQSVPLRKLNVIDIFVLAYAATVLISWILSDYRETAFIGNPRWSMGALMQLSLCGAYFLISRLWKPKKALIMLLFPVSTILFVLGYLNRFDIWPITMQVSSNTQFISLAGNINWYCGYLVIVLFFAVCLVWSGTFPLPAPLLYLYLFIGFCALVTNGSSSGIFTLAIICLILFYLSSSDPDKMRRFFAILLTCSLSCLMTLCLRLYFPDVYTYQETTNNFLTYTPLPVIMTCVCLCALILLNILKRKNIYPKRSLRLIANGVLFICIAGFILYIILLVYNTLFPGNIPVLSSLQAFTFNEEWGSRRGATWTIGFKIWQEQPLMHKIVGVGPDCMGSYLYTDASASLLDTVTAIWPNDMLSNAHCEWLTVLINTGILGLTAYAGLIISAICLFMKSGNKNTPGSSFTPAACGLAILAYSIHNIVSFQQILNLPTMFVILAIGAALMRCPDTDKTAGDTTDVPSDEPEEDPDTTDELQFLTI